MKNFFERFCYHFYKSPIFIFGPLFACLIVWLGFTFGFLVPRWSKFGTTMNSHEPLLWLFGMVLWFGLWIALFFGFANRGSKTWFAALEQANEFSREHGAFKPYLDKVIENLKKPSIDYQGKESVNYKRNVLLRSTLEQCKIYANEMGKMDLVNAFLRNLENEKEKNVFQFRNSRSKIEELQAQMTSNSTYYYDSTAGLLPPPPQKQGLIDF